MKLISMTDFVLEQHEQCISSTTDNVKYANFLKQPLKLEMFVPCDEDGNVLEEPSCMYIYKTQFFECTADETYRCRKYLEAKKKILFKDCTAYKPMLKSDYYIVEFNNIRMWLTNTNRNIEYLIQCDIQLTESAIKQLGL